MVNSIMEEYGGQLSYILMINLGGGAARSDLDILAELLKKLVHFQPKSKDWLSDALSSKDFPSQRIGSAEKRIWVQKVVKWV